MCLSGIDYAYEELLLVDEQSAGGFLGQGPSLAPHSNETAQAIDEELIEILGRAYEANLKHLAEERDRLEALAQRLLEQEKLEHEDLVELLGPHPGEA